jgi:hypothetical protein
MVLCMEDLNLLEPKEHERSVSCHQTHSLMRLPQGIPPGLAVVLPVSWPTLSLVTVRRPERETVQGRFLPTRWASKPVAWQAGRSGRWNSPSIGPKVRQPVSAATSPFQRTPLHSLQGAPAFLARWGAHRLAADVIVVNLNYKESTKSPTLSKIQILAKSKTTWFLYSYVIDLLQ